MRRKKSSEQPEDGRTGGRRSQSALVLGRGANSEGSPSVLQRRGTGAPRYEGRASNRKSLHVDDEALDVVQKQVAEKQRRNEQQEVAALCSVLPWSYGEQLFRFSSLF
jgi:hypothetical protein